MTKLGRPLAMSAEERRAEIFSAAEKLFGNQGFDAVTMADIAEASGMSKKTLYVYFSDKRELLQSLVRSSYIWPENAFLQQETDPLAFLKICLKTIAEHVLSERHIKLCRLAVSEDMGANGIGSTFYEMGIASSRNHLIQAIKPLEGRSVAQTLGAEALADMLFGASIAKPFIDMLFAGKAVHLTHVFEQIDVTADALFMK